MRRILFVLGIAVVMVLTMLSPVAARTAEPVFRQSVPMLDVADRAAEIGETISQIMGWLSGTDDDKSEEQDTTSQS